MSALVAFLVAWLSALLSFGPRPMSDSAGVAPPPPMETYATSNDTATTTGKHNGASDQGRSHIYNGI